MPWCRGRGAFPAGASRTRGAPMRFPTNFGPHAIHGLGWNRSWRLVEDDCRGNRRSVEMEFGAAWPFGGRAVQRFELAPDRLRLHIELHADERSFPAAVGWHPWFRRRLARGGAARLHFEARESYEMDDEIVPTAGCARFLPAPGTTASSASARHRASSGPAPCSSSCAPQWITGSSTSARNAGSASRP